MSAAYPYALVALGGALGAVARFGVGVFIVRRVPAGWPFATLFINLTGCFLIALFLSAATDRVGLQEGWRYLFPIGFVGAYTTFSTYEWEMFKLGEQGAWGQVGFYFVASNVLGYAAILLGNALGKRL
jgi:fluoride exporter